MAPLGGFSEREPELAVGHLLGLRWFHLGATARCHVTVTSSRSWEGFRYECACAPGHVVHVGTLDAGARWAAAHDGCIRPVLSGTREALEPGENAARCLASYKAYWPLEDFEDVHEVPHAPCGCGFWAYWALGAKQVNPPSAVGIIKGYGHVIEGDAGFRCSHATIAALHLPNWDEPAALALEDRYQVPVYQGLGAMLAMHPAPDGQPPLSDEYFARGVRAVQNNAAGGIVQRGASAGSMAAAMRGMAVPCAGCGIVACAPGQALCAHCQVRQLRCTRCGMSRSPVQALCAHCSHAAVAAGPAVPAAAATSGADAVAQLHKRREGWAAAAVAFGAMADAAAKAARHVRSLYGIPQPPEPPAGSDDPSGT